MEKWSPDIVLVDIEMPIMNGIEFLQQTVKVYPQTKFIIISGYDSFQYMREAIRLNVSDYILKPISFDNINNVFSNIIRELKKDSQNNIVYQNTILAKYINDIICDRTNPIGLLNNYGNRQFEQYTYFQMGIIEILNLEEVCELHHEGSRYAMQSFLVERLHVKYKDYFNIVFVGNYMQHNEIIMLTGIQNETKESQFYPNMVEAVSYIYNSFRVESISVFGKTVSFSSKNISSCYSKMHEQICQTNLVDIGKHDILPFLELSFDKNTVLKMHSMYDYENSFINVLRFGSIDLIEEAVNSLIDVIDNKRSYSIYLQQMYIEEMVVVINSVMRSVKKNMLFIDRIGCEKHIILVCDYNYKSLKKLLFNLCAFAKQRIRSDMDDDSQEKENVKFIKDYIDHNYEKKISLEKFSKMFYLCKDYLSRIFKREYGYNIYEYMLVIRMKNASEMIMNTNMKINDIAKMIGYTDYNYFSKAFKNKYGISPIQYRRSNQMRIPQDN